MGLFDYIRNNKKYKTDELYIGMLQTVSTIRNRTTFQRYSILRKLNRVETLHYLEDAFFKFLYKDDFMKSVPRYIREGYEFSDIEFYTSITVPYDEHFDRGLYAHTTPQHIINTNTSDGIYTIVRNVSSLKDSLSNGFQFAEKIRYEDIAELEQWINKSILSNEEDYHM